MTNTLTYTPFEPLQPPRPVARIAHIVRVCAGKNVLDLGALDETAFAKKRGHGVWLHEEIAKSAARVVGVDASDAVPAEGLKTAANAAIQRGDVLDLAPLLSRLGFVPDVVVAGELIEHLENPLAFLRAIRALPQLRGKTLVFSTPNATAMHNCLIGLGNRESTHKDHLCIQSFKTITTLLDRAGFETWSIVPYQSDFNEMKLRNHGLAHAVVVCGEAAIRLLERVFPLLSFGYIAEARI